MAEFQEAWADPAWQPGTQAVKEPLEGAKADCGNKQDQLAEGIHGHLKDRKAQEKVLKKN